MGGFDDDIMELTHCCGRHEAWVESSMVRLWQSGQWSWTSEMRHGGDNIYGSVICLYVEETTSWMMVCCRGRQRFQVEEDVTPCGSYRARVHQTHENKLSVGSPSHLSAQSYIIATVFICDGQWVLSIPEPTVMKRRLGALTLYFIESAKVGRTTFVRIYIGVDAVHFNIELRLNTFA